MKKRTDQIMKLDRLAIIATFGLIACGETIEELPPAPLVDTVDATNEQCPNGGTVIRSGVDSNEDGILQEDEVTSSEPVCNGGPGEPGDPGEDGSRSLVVQTEEPAGDNCEFGGQRIDAGFDDDADGELDDAEIDATTYVCRGAPGDDALQLLTVTSTDTDGQCPESGGTVIRSGLDDNRDGVLDEGEVDLERTVCGGDSSERNLVVVDQEPPGENCASGGQRIRSGIDVNDDGLLQESEVEQQELFCDPVLTLTEVTDLSVGTSTICTGGGQRIDIGVDGNDNGTLEAAEVDQTTFVCNGRGGEQLLVSRQVIGSGTECEVGGERVAWGLDTDGDGILDAGEEQTVTFVCDGADGAPGTEGSAVRVANEPPGTNCLRGGTRIETGPDLDGDGQLDDGEVRATSFSCDGPALSSLVDISPEPAGANCADGGQRIDTGTDDDGDGQLDPAEIDNTSYVCSSVATVPIGFVTTELPAAVPGLSYSAAIEATGGVGGSYTWSVVSGALPSSFSLDASGTPSTTLSGSPTTPGTFSFTIEVEDFFGNSETQAYTFVIEQPLTIETYTLPALENGTPYSATLTASGGAPPYTWSLDSGDLPTGLSISAGGSISGTPTSDYGTRFIVEVSDADGDTQKARYTIAGERRFIAYCGDFITDNFDELSLVELVNGAVTSTGTNITPEDGSPPAKAEINFCSDVQFSPAADQIALIADNGTADDLWVVDFSAFPTVTSVNVTNLGSGFDVFDLHWSPDGESIAYVADQDTGGDNELYVADVTDLNNITISKANSPFSSSFGDVTDFVWSPDSTQIAYLADGITDSEEELFVANVAAGGQGVRINTTLADDDVDDEFEFSPDSSWVLYAAEQDTSGVVELYIVDVSGASPGAPQKVNDPMVSFGDIGGGFPIDSDYGFSPSGTWVHYQADQDVSGLDQLYLFEVGTTNSPTLVSHPTTSSLEDVDTPQWDAIGRRLLFDGDSRLSSVDELFIVDTAIPLGGLPLRVNEDLNTDADVGSSWAISGDGAYVVYEADQVTNGDEEPYFVATDNLTVATRLLDGTSIVPDGVTDIGISDDGSVFYVVMDTDTGSPSPNELYAFFVAGGAPSLPSRVNGAFSSTSMDVNSSDIRFTQGSGGILYTSDENVVSDNEAFHVPFVGTSTGTQSTLNPALPSDGDVDDIYAQEL
jgi:hypothetical protein